MITVYKNSNLVLTQSQLSFLNHFDSLLGDWVDITHVISFNPDNNKMKIRVRKQSLVKKKRHPFYLCLALTFNPDGTVLKQYQLSKKSGLNDYQYLHDC